MSPFHKICLAHATVLAMTCHGTLHAWQQLLCAANLSEPARHGGAETNGRATGVGARPCTSCQNHVVCIYSTGLCLRQHHIGGCASLDHCCACLQNLAGLLITEQLGRWEELELAQSLQRLSVMECVPA